MASPQELPAAVVSENYILNKLAESERLLEAGVPAKVSTHNQADLERALWFLYQQWTAVGFRPRSFYRMFTPHTKQYRGGVAAVQTILRDDGASGFEFLKHRGKRQLSVESLVVREAWAHLFSDCDKRIAQQRLDGTAK